MDSPISFVSGHTPPEDNILFSIGTYQVFRSIGKGGMGEVFLAYDTTCGRRLALKKIRPDLIDFKKIHHRFLTEARITSQLTHPAIIPIYTIHEENGTIYYTMPFVEGKTLKQILHDTYKKEKKGEEAAHLGSIPSLMRIYIQVCQAIAYAHSNNVLHRDIKPENIIVGPFGEVFILDWGLAKIAHTPNEEEDLENQAGPEITRTGRVVGTVAFMAPERALGNPADFQTDIYALGVILYQILTLHLPFKREGLKEFRESMDKEILPDPAVIAPYRDVPDSLAHMVRKCLDKDPGDRYQTAQELIDDIENYIEGRFSWIPAAELNIHRKKDWEFQENVFLADHIAITRGAEESDWVSLMISKASYTDNIKFEATVKIGEKGQGIGILLSLPEASERIHLNEGYCLWLGSDLNKNTKLTRSAVEVIHAPEIYLQREVSYRLRIEKIDHNFSFYLNDTLQFSYISHLPLVGTHVGFIARDDNFAITTISISVGSQNIMVNCLAVPDAFLAHKDYHTALTEYRRIGESFRGRQEGREAIFRAGITLMEQAKANGDKQELFDLALEEFEKLHNTPGAPLEYLGKSLVYRALKEYEEEIKCFELAYRRYPNHPLLSVLQEQIIFRMHESSRLHRKATYYFILLAVQHLPKVIAGIHTKKLFKSLQKHWERLSFIEEDPEAPKTLQNADFGIQLAFWLGKPYVLTEFIQEQLKKANRSPKLIVNALFSLIELGSWELAESEMRNCLKRSRDKELKQKCHYLEPLFHYHQGLKPTFSPKTSLNKDEERIYFHIMEDALTQRNTSLVYSIVDAIQNCPMSEETALNLDCTHIWAALLDKNWNLASDLLHRYTLEELHKETSLLHFLYGCWLHVTEGEEIAGIHFRGVLPVAFPRTFALFGHYMYGKLEDQQTWLDKAFLWEKRKLWQQMSLFYHCVGDEGQSKHYAEMERRVYIRVPVD